MRAHSVAEAVGLLSEAGDLARPLVGGTDLLAQLRGDRRRLDRVVDIKEIPEASDLAYDPLRGLTLGAAVPCCRVYEDDAISRLYPGLVDAVSMIGGIQIQGRASVGGNLCNAAPSADAIPPLIVLGAIAEVAGPGGTRDVPVEEFCTAPGQTVLQRGEFLLRLRLPSPRPASGAHYLRFIPRNEMDIAVAGAGASVVLGGDGGTISEAWVALASVAPTPLKVEGVAAALVGNEPTDEVIVKAAEAAMEAARPITDMRGTADQRRHLVGVLTRRALKGAIQRAREA